MSNLRGEKVERLQSDRVDCYSSIDISILSKLLSKCPQWSLGNLHLYSTSQMTASNWYELADASRTGKIDKVRVSKRHIQQGRRENVEAVKEITEKWTEI